MGRVDTAWMGFLREIIMSCVNQGVKLHDRWELVPDRDPTEEQDWETDLKRGSGRRLKKIRNRGSIVLE